ncbi:MAG: type II secretion system F family protein [Bacillota bacterium]
MPILLWSLVASALYCFGVVLLRPEPATAGLRLSRLLPEAGGQTSAFRLSLQDPLTRHTIAGLAAGSMAGLSLALGRWPRVLPVLCMYFALERGLAMAQSAAATRANREVRRQLPGVIELLAVCADAGLSPAVSMELVGKRVGGLLGTLFIEAHRRSKSGDRLFATLRYLSVRENVAGLLPLVAALHTADELGVPIVDTLRQQAATARHQRTCELERAVTLVPPKLMVCAVVLFFPLLITVTLIPNVLTFLMSGW